MPDAPNDPVPTPTTAPPETDPILHALSETRAELARLREHLAAPHRPAPPAAPAPSGAMGPRPRDDRAARAAANAAAAAARTGDRRSLMTYLRLRREAAPGAAT